MSVFFDGNHVTINTGRYAGHNGTIHSWLHDDWYIVNVDLGTDRLGIRIVLRGSEMTKVEV